MIIGVGVIVRWRANTPGSGYDLWDGDRWVPITMAEYKSYVRERGLSVHTNPRWSGRG